MIKIAVIGNSHITMLREGFPDIEQSLAATLGTIEVSYFGIVGRRIRMCSVDKDGIFGWHGARALEPCEPDDIAERIIRINGADHFDLNGFDVLVGVGFYALPTWLAWSAQSTAIENIHDLHDGVHDLSYEAFLSMAEAAKAKVSQIDWLRHVPCPIRICLEAPMLSDAKIRTQDGEHDENLAVKAVTKDNPMHAILADAINFSHVALAERGANYLPQPTETLATRISSKPDYMGGSLNIHGGVRPAGDQNHGNGAMGAAYWRAIGEQILSLKVEQGGANALGS